MNIILSILSENDGCFTPETQKHLSYRCQEDYRADDVEFSQRRRGLSNQF
ncbi:hypothetical protein [Planktothrix agardhii]|nr:hypothetical protein [Planktothrix agardhii]